MRVVTILALTAVLFGCTSNTDVAADPPNMPPPSDNLCRCRGLRNTLALVRVEGDPVPFREQFSGLDTDWASGLEFTLVVEGAYVPPGQPADEMAPPMRIRVRQDLNGPGGSLHPSGSPTATPVRRDQRMFALLYPYWHNRTYWALEIQPFDATTGTLSRRWYQFPVGTPVTQVLDPSEWNNPTRGCQEPCQSALVVYGDAGADARPDDAASDR